MENRVEIVRKSVEFVETNWKLKKRYPDTVKIRVKKNTTGKS